MIDKTSLTNHFLISMPGMDDPNFAHTLTYVCEHSDEGAMGIIINRPTKIIFGEILDQLSIKIIDETLYNQPVYQGGPVQPERGFVIHDDKSVWDSTLSVSDEISITTSRDILQAIAINEGPRRILMALGYAGWASKQLEQELSANVWLSCPFDREILFSMPANERLDAAAKELGIDLNLISIEAGHA